MTFDTGDNLPSGSHALYHAAELLRKHGWRPLMALSDRFGRYCIILEQRDPQHIQIALAAKPSKIWHGTLSTQKKLLIKLARTNRPLVIHVKNHGFYVFNALDLFLNGKKSNMRFEEEMWNFSINLGVFWNGDAVDFDKILGWFKSRQLEAEGHLQTLQRRMEVSEQRAASA